MSQQIPAYERQPSYRDQPSSSRQQQSSHRSLLNQALSKREQAIESDKRPKTSNLNHYQKLFLEPPRQAAALKITEPHSESSKCCDNRHEIEEKFKQSNEKKRMKSRIQSIQKSLKISHLTIGTTKKKTVKPQREPSVQKLAIAYSIKDPSLLQIKKMLPVGYTSNKENEI